MEQLEFKFVTDEKRKMLESTLAVAQARLGFAIEHTRHFSFADVVHRERVVASIKKKLAELP